jgi:hypothetical protein
MFPTVAFDEAGNTGQNLLDPVQPVFVSAGVLLSEDDIRGLREELEWGEDEELHFKVLKRSRRGIERIVRLFDSPAITDRSVKSFAIHKPYMITTKVIDILMEELAHRHGVDLYRDGGAHATANLFYSVGPAFCGAGLYREMLERFVDMIRTRTGAAVKRFYTCLRDMYDACDDDVFGGGIAALIATEGIVDDIVARADITDLDPAIPAFIQVAGSWDAQLQKEWHIVHDESKPIAYEQDHIESYLDHPDEPRRAVGQGDHRIELPLRATRLDLRSSDEVPLLQVADVIASSGAHVLRGVADASYKDSLWHRLTDSALMELRIGRVWPSTEVDPEKLGRRGDDGSMVELSAGLIARSMERRYGPNWRERRRGRRRK